MKALNMRIGRILIASLDDLQKMYDAALGILDSVGMRVTHPVTLDCLEAYGARVSRADSMVRMPPKIVEKAVAAMKSASRTPPPSTGGFSDTLDLTLGDGCFFLYDYERRTRRKAKRDDFISIVRFADALPEVGSFSAPVEIGGLPVQTMVLEMQALSMLHSGKPSGVENNIPEQVRYLADLHKIARDYRGETGWGGNAQGVTSPLTFGDRASELYLEGGKYGFGAGVYTMAIAGTNAPATVEGCATQAAAEILGAWTCLMAMDENRQVGTLFLTGTTDMRTGKPCWSSPGAIRQNCLATWMFNEIVGVPVSMVWTWYTDAVEPGYRCTIDHMLKVLAMAPQFGRTSFHLGDLDGAAVFSLEQALLDLDWYRGIQQLYKPARFDDEMMAVEEIGRIGAEHGKTHLDTDFTLRHFRESLWAPETSPCVYWREDVEGVCEADVVRDANARWKRTVEEHEPYVPPKGMARAVAAVLDKARAELL